MTTLISAITFVTFLVVLVGVPLVLWKERPTGSGGTAWWVVVSALVALFAFVSLLAALELARETSPLAHVALCIVAIAVVVLFVKREAHPA